MCLVIQDAMHIILPVLTIIAGFVLMEGAAWFSHKYIMHGFMWRWHKSHHEPRKGRFEKNDLFAVFFAGISAGSIILGTADGSLGFGFWFGLGIFLYGIAYFLVHDVFIHRRLPMLRDSNSTYFKAMRYAHKIHHKVQTKYGAEAFGFLFVSRKYLNKFKNKNHA